MVASWEIIKKVELSVASDTIECTSIPEKMFLHVQIVGKASGTGISEHITFNGSTSGYTRMRRRAGESSESNSGGSSIDLTENGSRDIYYTQFDISNPATVQKMGEGEHVEIVSGTGSGNRMHRSEWGISWSNSSRITSIKYEDTNIVGWSAGSTMIVWGADSETLTNVYPKLQDGSVYEEQDTGKTYIWNLSTNTWNEIT